ncbi:MAG: polysaccharide deacetylase family protein [Fimbriimonadaceae bacterium]|nr:MAG: polysaccharide deacetylase family protein [Fimbriimonadaceae bacterium]
MGFIETASAPTYQLPIAGAWAAPPARVTDRPGNIKGDVMVLMYHRFEQSEKYMVRSLANFRSDLKRLRDAGFRPVTVSEYVDGKMDIPPGSSPVVLTFDDSWDTQFKLLRNGEPDPDTAVGVWLDFSKKHPEFPVKGTFFCLANGPFGTAAQGAKKIKMLQSWGSEIGAHTMTHPNLARLSDERVKEEMAKSKLYLESKGAKNVRTFALPYGNLPRNTSLLHGFVWKGKVFKYDAVVLAAGNPAPAPGSSRLNKLRIPRVIASQDTYGINNWLNRLQNKTWKPFVQP